jgi:MFS family permease
MAGSWLGGLLTDKVGAFRVQVLSLILGGVIFMLLSQVREFELLAGGVLLLSTIAETFRPANSASVSFYARPENITRAFSLNRMAINLGFSIGPALGGILAAWSYHYLFIADGLTCIAAGVFFFFYFRKKPGNSKPAKIEIESFAEKKLRPYHDFRFIFFLLMNTIFIMLFFQLFNTLPLYYREVHHLPEFNIGILLGLNGLIVFALEMPAVYLIGTKISFSKLISAGTLLTGISYLVLVSSAMDYILYIGMLLLSLAEILVMPFVATLAVQRSNEFNRGAYMGMLSLSFSLAIVLAPVFGTMIVDHFGFNILWYVVMGISVFLSLIFILIIPGLKSELNLPQPSSVKPVSN